jgi:hypothetical protein
MLKPGQMVTDGEDFTNLEERQDAAQQVRSGALRVHKDLVLLATLLRNDDLVIAVHFGGDGTGKRSRKFGGDK